MVGLADISHEPFSLLLGSTERKFGESNDRGHPSSTSHATMDTLAQLRDGTISILDAVATELPEVFIADILPRVRMLDILKLTLASKRYWNTWWSVRGVQLIGDKFKEHCESRCLYKCEREPMYWIVRCGIVPAVRSFLESGWHVDTRLVLGCGNVTKENRRIEGTSLHVAARCGRWPVIKVLIEAGADVNTVTALGKAKLGWTPLHYAALIGNAKCVALLIKAGANVHQVAEGYCRPIDAARGRRRLFPAGTSVSKKQGEKVVKLLRAAGVRHYG